MKTNKNEELQSRRDFFKAAAKAALPVIGAVVLSQLPMTTQASPMGCASYSCSHVCQDTCRNYCNGNCDNTCKNYGCRGYCNK